MQGFIRTLSVKPFYHLDVNTQRYREMFGSRISSGITGAADVGGGPLERHILAQRCPGALHKVLDAMLWWVECRVVGLKGCKEPLCVSFSFVICL